MKLFKRIYYSALALLTVLLLIFSFVDVSSAGAVRSPLNTDSIKTSVGTIAAFDGSRQNTAGLGSVRNYIEKTRLLSSDAITRVTPEVEDPDDESISLTDWERGNNGVPLPTLTVQSVAYSGNVGTSQYPEDNFYVAAHSIYNIIVAIPGTDTIAGNAAKAVMITAHYDARPDGGGAADNALAVSSMIENILYILDEGISYKNDLIFIFADSGQNNSIGMRAFTEYFKGFDDIYSRTVLAASFGSMGNGGTMVLSYTGEGDLKLINQYKKASASTYNSSLVTTMLENNSYAVSAPVTGDVPSLGFVNVGGLKAFQSSLDTADKLSDKLVSANCGLMYNFINCFGNVGAGDLKSDYSAVFFSYLGLTVSYSAVTAYVFIGVLIAGIIAAFALNAKTKAFKASKLLAGAAAQLLSLAATLVVMYVFYYVITLMLTGFGITAFHAISRLYSYNAGTLIFAALLGSAVLIAFYIILKKVFNVKAADTVRGNVLLVSLAAIILTAVNVRLSFLLLPLAVLEAAVLVITTVFKSSFKKKFSMDIERLFLYVVPAIILLPVTLCALCFIIKLNALTVLPAAMLLLLASTGFIAPYFDYLNPALDKLCKKLPGRTIRVQRTVTELQEHKAKKGKFTEVTYTKVEKEKVEWNYKNRFALPGFAFLCVFAIIMFSLFGTAFNNSTTGYYTYADSVYNDAIVYVWEKDAGGTVSKTIQIRDLTAYKYLRNAIDDLEWNAEKGMYYKNDNNTDVTVVQPQFTKSGGSFTVNPSDGTRSYVYLHFYNASSIAVLTFTNERGDEFELKVSGQKEFTVSMPYGFGRYFTMSAQDEGEDSVSGFGVNYEEHRPGSESNIRSLKEWNDVRSHFADSDIANRLRGAIIIKVSNAF